MSMEPMSAAPMSEPGYPMRFDVEYPEKLSRLLIFVKWILAIPHFLIVYVLGSLGSIITFIAFFAILFTKKYPRGLFDMYVNIQRWTMNAYVYGLLDMRDEYPPFSWEAGQYPLTYEVDYPEELSRFAPLYKWLLALPHYIVLMVLFICAAVVWVLAFFAILFTGRYPRGMFDFMVGVIRWSSRVNAYVYLLRDEYPPFSMK